MFKSPRRNGRNKGLKIKHVIQISLLLGVSVWLLYQIHHSDDKKPSPTINVSHKLNNDSSKDISKLGRKVLRPKVKETREQHRVEDEQNNESEGSEDVEDHESDEHEEAEHTDGKEDSEEIIKEHENDEVIKGKLNVNTSNEQNRAVVMDNIDKDVSPSEDDDRTRNEHNSKEQTAQQIGYAPDSYSNETDTAKYVKPTGNEKNMKGESYSGGQSKKDDVPVLEEEKDAFTELETLPENVTGGSVSLENAATE